MFGIGGEEFIFIIFIILILFGSDKIPEIARTLGKAMSQLKHATNDIKNEIQRSAEDNGIDVNSLTGGISDEIKKVKQDVTQMVQPNDRLNINAEIEKAKEDIEQITGPIKRQF